MPVLETFLPPDRRWALAQGQDLPDRAFGAVLFADVSGFTPLTEAMTRILGSRRGAEELTTRLNRVYDVLLARIESYGGSVVTFAGDAALCWFAETESRTATAARAIACAFALQDAMRQFSAVPLPDGTTTALAIKVTVAYGSVRRFVVGDPNIRQLDTIAGSTVARTAAAEHLAGPGAILVDQAVAEAAGAQVEIAEWRDDANTRERFAVLNHARAAAPPASPPPPPRLKPEVLKPWLHAAVYERVRAEGEIFLTELRPVVAMFVRFQGIDFDADDAAGDKLNRFIVRVQQILARYEGTLLEVTIGDKGSYFYAAFGAPHSHEDDARRAVMAARDLFPLCAELGFVEPLQIGLSQGVMRVGSYGGATRRMYGAQGDEVNLAARLMTEAEPGTVLVSGRIQKAVANEFDLEPIAPIRLKGKSEPLLPFVVQGLRGTRIQQLQEAYYSLPMIGRERELAEAQEKLERARRGEGQIVGITAGAGMGKSRLTAEMIRAARRRRESTYGGECQSFGTNISYLVWTPIWRAFFGLDANLPLRRQLRALENQIQDLAPERIDALPLLGSVLNLSIPDNDFTRPLEPEFRKSALYALLMDCLRAAAQDARTEGQALVLVVEDAHWIDPASRDLLQELAANLQTLPVMLLINYRPPEGTTEPLSRVRALPNFTEITLTELTGAQGEGLIRAKLAQHAPESAGTVPAELVAGVLAQAQGNPFYIEQLLDYMHDRGINFRDPTAFAELELPNTLHRLVLSRIDRLNERQQLTLKAASIIGRWFTLAHLCGYFPQVGSPDRVQTELAFLQNYDLTALDHPEPELSYFFKHIVTHQVAYESLPHATRAMLHEAYALFLESHDDPARALDLLAYHYDRSENMEKRREYLRRAGDAAAARFANTEALDYMTRALALAPPDDLAARYDLLCTREHIYDVQGEREKQRADLASLEELVPTLGDPEKQLNVMVKRAWLAERTTDHRVALEILRRIENAPGRVELSSAARAETDLEVALLHGVILWQQGDAVHAGPYFERALNLARASENRVAQARALSFLGTVERESGKYSSAEAHFQEQLELARALEDRRREWAALNNLGLVANARGDSRSAAEFYQDALRIVRDIGDRLGQLQLLRNMAIVYTDGGEYTLSVKYSQEVLAIGNAIGDLRSVNSLYLNLGEAFRLSGEYAEANRNTERALAAAREMGDRLVENFALMNLGAIALAEGDLERARGSIESGLPIAREIGHREGEGFLLNTLGQVQLDSGETGTAQATFENALAVWDSLEPSVYALDAHAGLAELALRRDDLDTARTHADTILAYLDAHPAQRGAPSALNASLSAYHVLARAADLRARDVLESAHSALQARTEKIADENLRRAFSEYVPVNRAVREAFLALASG